MAFKRFSLKFPLFFPYCQYIGFVICWSYLLQPCMRIVWDQMHPLLYACAWWLLSRSLIAFNFALSCGTAWWFRALGLLWILLYACMFVDFHLEYYFIGLCTWLFSEEHTLALQVVWLLLHSKTSVLCSWVPSKKISSIIRHVYHKIRLEITRHMVMSHSMIQANLSITCIHKTLYESMQSIWILIFSLD